MGCTIDPSGPSGEIPAPVLPYLGSCGCPRGFSSSPGLITTSDYCPEDGVLHTPTAVVVCEAPELLANADWTGAFVTSSAPECATGMSGCAVANPYTEACSCPTDAADVVATTFARCGDGNDHQVEIHICVDLAVEAISFGGAYQTHWLGDSPAECTAGNPRAGDECGCPAGFAPQALRITSPTPDQGGDLFFCVPG
jgi:hypothetical protein